MSAETKKTAKEISESSKRLADAAGELARKAAPLGDKGLVEKIKKVQQGASEVATHIDERSGKGA